MAKAFGTKIEDRTASVPDSSCKWTGASLGGFIPSHPELTLSITRRRITKAEFVKNYSVQILPGATPGKMERDPAPQVQGVGQAAFTALHGQELSVWDHGVVLTISTAYVSSPLDTAKRLARSALARLRAG